MSGMVLTGAAGSSSTEEESTASHCRDQEQPGGVAASGSHWW